VPSMQTERSLRQRSG